MYNLIKLFWPETQKMLYLATLTGVHAIVEAWGLVPTDLTLHTDPCPCAFLAAKTQLLWQRGGRGMGQVWMKKCINIKA